MARADRLAWAGRLVALVGLVVLVIAVLRACAPTESVRVLAVGDMACSPTDPAFGDAAGVDDECIAARVSDAAIARDPDVLLGLGDYQYEVASAADWAAGYAPTWGRLREITRPAVGNQELKVHKASSFYEFFGELAPESPGYHSYELGGWHVVVLNTNCTVVPGGCGEESPQVAWLREDLAANEGRCILAYGHHPRWSNGIAGPNPLLDPLYAAMVEGGVTAYLAAHEANYERFPALDRAHRPDPDGVMQFVVGTGGQSLYEPAEGDAPWRETFDAIPSDIFTADHHGFLDLRLDDGSMSWAFVTDQGVVIDSGRASCVSTAP